MIKINRPIPEDAPKHCEYYFSLAKEDNLIDALESSKKLTVGLICSIPFSKEMFSYAPEKWTIRTVFSHIIDCERFYTYYAMRYSRKNHVEMNKFDRTLNGLNDNANSRALKDIREEFISVRDATINLFSYMTNDMLDFRSDANDFIYTPRSLGWMTAGHNIHHCNLIKQKYLSV